MKARIVLENGNTFEGRFIGPKRSELYAELMFDTRVVGYQELLTDPAHAGKFIAFTYPLIGNYGINDKFNESDKVRARAVIIKENSRISSNWQAQASFLDFLKKQGLVAISGIDTRTLTVHLRNQGAVWAAISGGGIDPKEIISGLKQHKRKTRCDYIREISVKKISSPNLATKHRKVSAKIGILDLGAPKSLLRAIISLGAQPTLLPYNTRAADILKFKFNGLIISSGPEEDTALDQVVESTANLIGKVAILGISTGHQVICRAMGAKVTRMATGHNGVNYPVIGPQTKKGEITVQNHNFVVDRASLNKIRAVKLTGLNLNDATVEAVESPKLKIIGLQYYPSSPGFDTPHPQLKRFLTLCG